MVDYQITILCLDDNLEAIGIRSMLESFNVSVQCHFIGNVKDYINLLTKQDSKTLVIICAHGSKDGTVLAELGPELEAIMPYKRVLTTTNYQEFLKLKGQIIINTSCCGASLASAFVQNGAKAYIGVDGYVDGSSSTYFAVSFLYNLFYLKLNLKEAHTKAAEHDADTQMFRLFEQ